MSNNAAIIYARLSSRRLPRKALLPLVNETSLIEVVIKRLQKNDDYKIVLATSENIEDDELALIAEKYGILFFRGNLNDVAKRTIDCIDKFNIDYFARINGDSPFIDSSLIANGFKLVQDNYRDLVTNIFPRSFPYGYSLEVLNAKKFKSLYSQFEETHREHITSFYYENIDAMRYLNLSTNLDFEQQIRLTVDTETDYINIFNLFKSYPDLMELDIYDVVKKYRENNLLC